MVEQEHKIQIERAEEEGRGAFLIAKQGIRLAQMTYSRTSDNLVIIDHTEVDDQLRGLGVGRKLLDAVVAWARETHTKVIATCPYAKAQFERDPSIRDVLS
jgi:predicted GNAT family acetyltransferase